jgi:hypothetical protein
MKQVLCLMHNYFITYVYILMHVCLCVCVCVSITVYHSTVYSQQQNSNETLNNEDLVRNISVILKLAADG